MTVPKSGTHFLQYIVSSVTNNLVYWTSDDMDKDAIETITIHTSSGAYGFLTDKNLMDKKIILLVRDPRDVVLSSIDDVSNHGIDTWVGLPNYLTQESWSVLPFTDKINWLIDSLTPYPRGSCVEYFENTLQFLANKYILIVKYEDLVEAPDNHDRAIRELAEFIGYPISESRAEKLYKATYLMQTGTLNKGIANCYLMEYFDYPY